MPKRQTSNQQDAALKCQRLESRNVNSQNRPKAQAPLPPVPLQSPHEGPPQPWNQPYRRHDVVKIQKRKHRAGELVHQRTGERCKRSNPQPPLKEIKSQPAQKRMNDEVQFERIVEGQKKMEEV